MYAAEVLQLRTIYFLISKAMGIGFIAIIIIFQPELRKILERVGKGKFKLFGKTKEDTKIVKTQIAECLTAVRCVSGANVTVLGKDKGAHITYNGSNFIIPFLEICFDLICAAGTIADIA